MTEQKKEPRVEYSHAKLNERFRAWSRLRPHDGDAPLAGQATLREAAWHRYCDARDGLAEGTSARVFKSTAHDVDPRQIAMFPFSADGGKDL